MGCHQHLKCFPDPFHFFCFSSIRSQKKFRRRNVPSVNSPSEVLIWINCWTCPCKYSLKCKKRMFTRILGCRDQLLEMMDSRVRRRFRRGLKRKHMALLKKLRAAKKEATELEKPAVVKTHLRNMVIVPEMVGSIVGVYNGKVFNSVEVKVSSIN